MSTASQVASNGSQASFNVRNAPVPAGGGFEQSLTQVQYRKRQGGSGLKARTGEGGGSTGSAGTSSGSAKDQESRVTRDERETGDERKGQDGGSSQTAGDRPSVTDRKETGKGARAEVAPEQAPMQGQGGKHESRLGTGDRSGSAARAAPQGGTAKAEPEVRVTRDGREAGDERKGRDGEASHPADPDSATAAGGRQDHAAKGVPGTRPGANDSSVFPADKTLSMRVGSSPLSGGKRDPALGLAVNLSGLHETRSSTLALDAAGRVGQGGAAALADEKAAVPSPLPLPQSLQDDLMRVNAISQQVLFDKTANVGFAWENGHNFEPGEYAKLDTTKKAKLLSSLIHTKAVYFANRNAAVPSLNIVNDNEIVAALDRGIKTLHGDPAVQNFFEEQIGPEVRRRMGQPENSQLLSSIMKVAGPDLAGGGIFRRAAAAGKGPDNTMRSFALMAGAVRQVIPPGLYQQMLPSMRDYAGKFIIEHAARSAGEQQMQDFMGAQPLNRASVYDPAIVNPSIALQAALLAKRTGAPENEALRAVANVVARAVTLTRQGFKLDNAIFKAKDEFRTFPSFPGAGSMAWREGLFHAANAVCSGMQIAANNIGKRSFSPQDKAAIAFQATQAADLAVEASTKFLDANTATSRSEFGEVVRRLQRTYFSPSNIGNAAMFAGGVAGLGGAVMSFMSASKDKDVGSKILDTVSGIAGLGSGASSVGEAATYFLGHEDVVVTRGIASAVGRAIGIEGALGEAVSGARLAASVIAASTVTICSVLGLGAAIGQIIAFIAKGNRATDRTRQDLDSRLQRTIGMQIQLQRFTGPGGLPDPTDPPLKPYVPVPKFPGNG